MQIITKWGRLLFLYPREMSEYFVQLQVMDYGEIKDGGKR